MNKEKQQIKIAEACGWRLFSSFDNLWAAPGHVVEYDCDAYPLPDYLNDLNAMHEAEEMLGATQMHHYGQWLQNIYGPIYRATAEQRAEAFLKTLNLWEE